MKLIASLNSPYPLPENKWKLILSISVFISFFLFVFQPFGLRLLDSGDKTLKIIGYGGVTFIVLLFNIYFLESVFPVYFSEKNWTVLKQIVWLLWILFTIGLANFFYSHAIIPGIRLTWHNFLSFQLFTLIVGSFPVIVATLVTHNIYLRRYAGLADRINMQGMGGSDGAVDVSSNKLCIVNEAGNEELHFPAGELLFIESEGNYVTVHRKHGEKNEKTTIRNTLKNIRDQLAGFPCIIQCHRAFIVNCNHVVNVKGNAQGYRLKLVGDDDFVPVSRSFIDSFNQVFRR